MTDTFVRANLSQPVRTLEGSYYTSQDVFAREQERIFARSWVYVARVEQIAAPGDFVLAEIAGESLIITRDRGGELHAFFNVCRHRGTRICTSAQGNFASSIQCPYHAWTYGLDGTLLAARNMSDAPGFSSTDYPLHEAVVASRGGFVFANIAREPEPFANEFTSFFDGLAAWTPANLRKAHEITYELASNWKLVFQNYSECYHCPLVHPQLERLSSSDSGRNDLVAGSILGGYSELRHPGTTLTTTGRSSRPPLAGVFGANLDRVYYYTLFPSLLLSLHPDYMMVHVVTPVAVDRTRIVCAWYFDPAEIDRPEFDPRDAVDFWDLTNRQDWHVSERTQLGVKSRAYVPGPYAQAEGLLAAFDRHYLQRMDATSA